MCQVLGFFFLAYFLSFPTAFDAALGFVGASIRLTQPFQVKAPEPSPRLVRYCRESYISIRRPCRTRLT